MLRRGELERSDCVLLDLNLPGTTGLDGLRAILQADSVAAVCVLTGLDDQHLGIAAVAAGAQDYLVKGKADGEVLVRAIRYAVERRRAEASLLRLREEQLAAAESSRLERGLLPSPLLAGSPVRAHTFYRSGRTRAVIGGDFFDAVLGPPAPCTRSSATCAGTGRTRRPSGPCCGCRGGRSSSPASTSPSCCPSCSRCWSASGTTGRCSPPPPPSPCAADDGSSRLHALVRLAGHPPPLVLGRAPHTVAPPVGLPLGVRPNVRWQAAEVALEPGWALLLHTDGLIEGRGADPDELLWTEGLIDVLAAERDRDLDRLPERLVERAEQLNGGALVDDVAILLLSHDATPSDAAPAGVVVAAGDRA